MTETPAGSDESPRAGERCDTTGDFENGCPEREPPQALTQLSSVEANDRVLSQPEESGPTATLTDFEKTIEPDGSNRLRVSMWKNNEPQDVWCPKSIATAFPELSHPARFGQNEGERGRRNHHFSEQSTQFVGWRIVGATRRGRMHAHRAQYREDAFAYRATEKFAVLCVSDGAGAAPLSRIGSEVACNQMVESISEEIAHLAGFDMTRRGDESNPIPRAISRAVELTCARLRAIAVAGGFQPKDFRCTLLLSVVLNTPVGPIIFASQIGDGAICALRKNKAVQLLAEPDTGSYAGEVSCFLPDDSALTRGQKVTAVEGNKVECLLMCTDGVDDSFYPLEKCGSLLFDQLYSGVTTPAVDLDQVLQTSILFDSRPEIELLNWLDFKKRGENDDRTILLMFRDGRLSTIPTESE